MQRLLALSLALSLTPVFSQDLISSCASWHPTLEAECQSCFDSNDGSACDSLVGACSGIDLGGLGTLLCEDCYQDKDYGMCAQNYNMIAANACAARHPNYAYECDVCFSGDSDACSLLITECGETETCIDCYQDKNHAQCVQLDAANSDPCADLDPDGGCDTACQDATAWINAGCCTGC